MPTSPRRVRFQSGQIDGHACTVGIRADEGIDPDDFLFIRNSPIPSPSQIFSRWEISRMPPCRWRSFSFTTSVACASRWFTGSSCRRKGASRRNALVSKIFFRSPGERFPPLGSTVYSSGFPKPISSSSASAAGHLSSPRNRFSQTVPKKIAPL